MSSFPKTTVKLQQQSEEKKEHNQGFNIWLKDRCSFETMKVQQQIKMLLLKI